MNRIFQSIATFTGRVTGCGRQNISRCCYEKPCTIEEEKEQGVKFLIKKHPSDHLGSYFDKHHKIIYFRTESGKRSSDNKKKEDFSHSYQWNPHCTLTFLETIGWSTSLLLGWHLCHPWAPQYQAENLHNYKEKAKSYFVQTTNSYSSLAHALSRVILQSKPLNNHHNVQSFVLEQKKIKDETPVLKVQNSPLPDTCNTQFDGLDEQQETFGSDSAYSLSSNSESFIVFESEKSGCFDNESISFEDDCASVSFQGDCPINFDVDEKSKVEKELDAAYNDLNGEMNIVLQDAHINMGLKLISMHQNGKAFAHFQKAASMGSVQAIFNVALCYELGKGIRQDLIKAAEYYRQAALLGHPTAMYNLAVFLIQGKGGIPKQEDKAMVLLKEAANRGQQQAINLFESQTQQITSINKSASSPMLSPSTVDKYFPNGTLSSSMHDISLRCY